MLLTSDVVDTVTLILKIKHEALIWQKRLIYHITKPVFSIFREIN